MYFFAKKYENSIEFDFIRKQNIKDYQSLRFKRGNEILISFSLQKKQQKTKLKTLLFLEALSLTKAFFKFDILSTKSRRKQNYSAVQLRTFSHKNSNYFLYNFNKNSVGLIKNLQDFKKEFEPTCFDFLIQKTNGLNKSIKLQSRISSSKLNFYRLFL